MIFNYYILFIGLCLTIWHCAISALLNSYRFILYAPSIWQLGKNNFDKPSHYQNSLAGNGFVKVKILF